MSAFKSLLEETLEAWEDTRLGIVDEVENIPEDQFDFKPADEVRSVREQVLHILEVAMMMTGELTRDDTDFKRAPWPKLLKMYAEEAYQAKTKAELVELLKSQLESAIKQFKEVGELHMLQFIERFDGSPGTRLAWLEHGIAQEMYHRGQLTVYERLMGIEPALTKKIKGG
ncbi:DinB family protein [candidate division KSB1 bacterium]|nr:DinB family protein [candidate division KSB1 bacterium]NIR69545.1 DinB family protein [candidate division KSB1 bacterium]NIS22855.1 DinB family protein [candidate division KSB1 bacterium]NIT69692.1 DinB family protein [candidate division KSB1 bacterium]NIU23361.1 DinB family protein [candidate division KSB1 bacterium]